MENNTVGRAHVHQVLDWDIRTYPKVVDADVKDQYALIKVAYMEHELHKETSCDGVSFPLTSREWMRRTHVDVLWNFSYIGEPGDAPPTIGFGYEGHRFPITPDLVIPIVLLCFMPPLDIPEGVRCEGIVLSSARRRYMARRPWYVGTALDQTSMVVHVIASGGTFGIPCVPTTRHAKPMSNKQMNWWNWFRRLFSCGLPPYVRMIEMDMRAVRLVDLRVKKDQ